MRGFVYVQARMQARYGERLDSAAWNRLESSASFSVFLKNTRETSMAPWVSAVDDDVDIHELEDLLKNHLFIFIQEAESWVPTEWKAAVGWCKKLFELSEEDGLSSWLKQWRSLWPTKKNQQQLEELITLIQHHYQHFISLDDPDHGSSARQDLKYALELRFRRFAATPGALFVYLLLLALDYERLRGDLASRLLFGDEHEVDS
ncbi:MAG: hypothetical protein HQL70_01510 [Magnetococcales bacterium]|nr:hypothetical protein [Magnetococcales bacterium]